MRKSIHDNLAQLSKTHVCFPTGFSTIRHESRPLVEAQFRVARLLLHEMGHSIMRAGAGRANKEFCFMGSSAAEAGFELESQVFGGCRLILNHQNLSMAADWPSRDITELYRKTTKRISTDRIVHAGMYRRVPFQFVADLFTQKFWKKLTKQSDQSLVPPTVGAWCFLVGPEVRQVSWPAKLIVTDQTCNLSVAAN